MDRKTVKILQYYSLNHIKRLQPLQQFPDDHHNSGKVCTRFPLFFSQKYLTGSVYSKHFY